MASLYADLTKKASDLVCKPYPVSCEHGARDHAIVEVVGESTDGVKIEATFESHKAASSESHQVAKVDISKDYKERELASKVTLNSKDNLIAASLTANNKLGANSKVEVNGKHFNGKAGPEVALGVSSEVKTDSIGFNVKGEYQLNSHSWSSDFAIVFRKGIYQAGVAAKFAPSDQGPLKSLAGSLAFGWTDSSLVATIDSCGNQVGGHLAYHQRICSDCNGQLAVVIDGPVPVLSKLHETKAKIAGQYNPNIDTTFSALITSDFDIGLALKLRVNESVTVSGSTFGSVSNKGSDRVFGLNIDFTP